jgi:hypothetical protein
MSSVPLGSSTSAAEVTNISRHGVWLLVDDRELFMPFDEFPWFKNAPVESVLNLERRSENHLYWPGLDVDLTIDSIENPSKYPLKARHT